MKRIKRLPLLIANAIAMAIVFAIVCMSFSGCGGGVNQANTQTTAQAAQTAQEAQQSQSTVAGQSGQQAQPETQKPDGTGETVTETFTYWIRQGIDSSYVAKYEDLPVVKYLTSKVWGNDEKGNDVKIAFDFLVPIAGSEQENYNTMLATGEYPDIMYANIQNPVSELYQDGIILDLTEYVGKYMPNYTGFLDTVPSIAKLVTNNVDGSNKYLQIYGLSAGRSSFGFGYQYRRDWIVKYGANPIDGSAFSGSYKETNKDSSLYVLSWEDNVVFPSGGSNPIYISDWEWMFNIFDKAIEDQNIDDGYCLSLNYSGSFGTGELVNAFGGGGPEWYRTSDDKIEFGATGDDYRTYIQAMNTWFKNGWIDAAFPEHTDVAMFWRIDEAKYRSGKVGLWYGQSNTLGGRLDNGEDLLDGIVMFAAQAPINDIFGADAQRNKTPYTMFQSSQISGISIVITEKAKNKNLEALFNLFNYMYSEDYAVTGSFGLSKEQYEEIADELYPKWGLADGAYKTIETSDGTRYEKVETIKSDGAFLDNAAIPVRLPQLGYGGILEFRSEPKSYLDNWDLWLAYDNIGYLEQAFTSQLSLEEAPIVSKTTMNVREYMEKNIPSYIMGGKDPYNDADWKVFIDGINNYDPEAVTKIYQDLLDLLNK